MTRTLKLNRRVIRKLDPATRRHLMAQHELATHPNEKALQVACCEWLELYDPSVVWLHVAQVVTPFFKGVADLICCIGGRYYAIELKGPRARISAEQTRFLASVKEAGGVAEVVRSVAELAEVVQGGAEATGLNVMANKEKFSVAQVAAALKRSKGNRSVAAGILKCQPMTVYRYEARHPSLAEIAAQGQEERLDIAEDVLLDLVREGNLGAVCFLLKTKGKSRGFVERQELTGADGGPVTYQVEIDTDGDDDQEV